jgi:hypothetical protein
MHHFRRDAYADEAVSQGGINWPQTFVALGVVGVAAWGLWFFLRDRSDVQGGVPAAGPAGPPVHSENVPEETPGGILVRAIDPVTGLPLVIPEVPGGRAPQGAGGPPVFLVGDPILLKNGQRYRAKLALTGLEASFATSDLVRAKFLSNGFVNVFATRNPAELPAGWPAETKGAGSGVWWVEGDWARPTANVDREPQISQVWVA